MKSYVYLHGFASSPASTKARFFLSKLAQHGITLQVPELDGGDFEHLTVSGQLAVVRECAPAGPLVLIGSSLGGYLAALYAERHADVERLVLMAPAFDFQARWAARLGQDTMAQWKREGKLSLYHYGLKRDSLLSYEFYEDVAHYAAYPDVPQPCLVIQGNRDDVVTPEVAVQFCERRPSATLYRFESGHELTDVLGEIWAVTEPFLLHG